MLWWFFPSGVHIGVESFRSSNVNSVLMSKVPGFHFGQGLGVHCRSSFGSPAESIAESNDRPWDLLLGLKLRPESPERSLRR